MTNAQPPHTIIFLHIPKTAGTTLHHIINRQYRQRQLYVYDNSREDALDAFINLSPQTKASLKLIRGHLSYGLHEHLPGTHSYFTFLRDPVDRVLSHYYYQFATTRHLLPTGRYGTGTSDHA